MKKQHLYRVAAILLFLCIFLGIMPRHALQATAAEAENTFPEEGKIYYILCTYTYDDEGSDRTAYGFLDTQLNTFWESGTQTDTFVLPASGKLDADGSKNLMRGFTIEKTEDGYYKFLPVCMPGRCMQLSQKFTNGLTLRVGFYEGKPEQKWILTPQENGGYYLSNAVYPNRPLALSQGRVRPLPVYSSGHRTFTFSFVEAPLNFTANRIFVKAPEEWYPALWVEQDLSHAWHGAIAMEKCTDGWYSYMAPPGDSCKIVNLLTSYINLSHYEQDFSQ